MHTQKNTRQKALFTGRLLSFNYSKKSKYTMQPVNGAVAIKKRKTGIIISFIMYFFIFLNFLFILFFFMLSRVLSFFCVCERFRKSSNPVRNLFLQAGAQAANGGAIITASPLLSRCRFNAPALAGSLWFFFAVVHRNKNTLPAIFYR